MALDLFLITFINDFSRKAEKLERDFLRNSEKDDYGRVPDYVKLKKYLNDLLNLGKDIFVEHGWGKSYGGYSPDILVHNSIFYTKYKERICTLEKAEQEIAKKFRGGQTESKFNYSSFHGYNIAYRDIYYPTNRYLRGADRYQISNWQSTPSYAKEMLISFRKGEYRYGEYCIADYLLEQYISNDIHNLTLCVIPAHSTIESELRFKQLCAVVSQKYEILDGFTYIKDNGYNRDPRNLWMKSDMGMFLSYSPYVTNRDIILFDDYIATGTSFIQVANALTTSGARSVRGLFMGKLI